MNMNCQILTKFPSPKVIEQGMKDGTIVQGGTGFGRYCFYGCHCLPDHEHASKSKPFGKPKEKFRYYFF